MKYLLMAAVVALATPAAATSLTDVQRAMAQTKTMSADFVQVAADGRSTRGTMLLKRPGRIRFDYSQSVPYLVVADGRNLSFVDYQVNQVSQWPVRSTALGVLLDPAADLSRMARVLPADASPEPGRVAVMAQDPKKPEQGRILFLLAEDGQAPGGLRLTGWRVTDAQNNQTIVTLSNVKHNLQLEDRRFTFRDPRPRLKPPGRPN